MDGMKYFFVLVTVVGAIFTLFLFVRSVIFSFYTIRHWKEAFATVISYQAEESDDKDTWRKVLRYTYQVNDTTYTSDTLGYNLTMGFADSIETEKYYNDYVINQRIAIKYNPLKPHKAVVEGRFDYMNILWLAFAGIFLAVAYHCYTT